MQYKDLNEYLNAHKIKELEIRCTDVCQDSAH